MPRQIAIPCILMRGGTSKGPYFNLNDLPADEETRARVLLSVMGSPHIRQIDGIGGADPVTSKVAMISPSKREGVDVDYLFAQVSVERAIVDTAPSCGNILSGVGPYAIETGLVKPTGDETRVVIFNVNTNSRIEAIVQTPGGEITYDGDTAIAGAPGTAAPVRLNFMDIVGSKTGRMLPTGKVREEIDGVAVTLIDVAMPMMILRADALGKTGYETAAELDADRDFYARVEQLRLEAGRRMGLGDVSDKVIPKVGLVAAPREGGSIASRYLMPHKTHNAYAVTGSMCMSSCAALKGSVAAEVAQMPPGDDRVVWIEHPTGMIDVALKTRGEGANMEVVSGGALRTARKLMEGHVFVPASVWQEKSVSDAA